MPTSAGASSTPNRFPRRRASPHARQGDADRREQGVRHHDRLRHAHPRLLRPAGPRPRRRRTCPEARPARRPGPRAGPPRAGHRQVGSTPAAGRARPRPSNSVSTRARSLPRGRRPHAQDDRPREGQALDVAQLRVRGEPGLGDRERRVQEASPPRPRRAAAPTAGAGPGARRSARGRQREARPGAAARGQGRRARTGDSTRRSTTARYASPSSASVTWAQRTRGIRIEAGHDQEGDRERHRGPRRRPDARAEDGRGQQGHQEGAADEGDRRPPSRRRAGDRWSGPRASGTREPRAMRRIPGAGQRATQRGTPGGTPGERQADHAPAPPGPGARRARPRTPRWRRPPWPPPAPAPGGRDRAGAAAPGQARRASCARGEGALAAIHRSTSAGVICEIWPSSAPTCGPGARGGALVDDDHGTAVPSAFTSRRNRSRGSSQSWSTATRW